MGGDIYRVFDTWYASFIHKETTGISLKSCIDGDTARFVVDGNEKTIRFSAINTPEFSPDKKEKFGKTAAEFTCKKLKQAKEISVEWDTTQEASHQREIGIIFVDGENLNLLLVREGYADLRYLKDYMPYAREYREALNLAKQEKKVLWS